MERISNLAASNSVLDILFRTQQRLHDLEVQVTSEKVSQDYTGIARQTGSLLNMENSRDILDRFASNNQMMETRLDLVATTVEGARTTIHDFRQLLLDVGTGTPLDQTHIDDLQAAAFRALKDLETHLNTEVDGRYVFAGGRVTTEPVELNLTSLADFQATYDGATVKYAETRDANLERFSLSADAAGNGNWLIFEADPGGTGGPSRITATTAQFANIAPGTTITLSGTPGGVNDGTFTVEAVGGGGTTLDLVTRKFVAEGPVGATLAAPGGTTLLPAATGGLTFASGATDTVTAATAGSLAAIPVGSAFTVSGSAGNDGTYTVLANDGTAITIAAKKLVDQGAAAAEVAGTVAAASYYRGDSVVLGHRVDQNRDFDIDLTAIHPGFEKAIRAIAIIAQGVQGSEGGLDQNLGRIDDAIALLNNALDRNVDDPPPYGAELDGTIERAQMDIGYQQVLIHDTNERHKEFIATLEGRVADIENADPTEAITKLLDQSRALEASYQAISRIRQLSLTDYL
jgi:flagellin-like hook-associated protein FlgL